MLCDEPVVAGPVPPDWLVRFAAARELGAHHGVHLVDWIGCDDEWFRSTRLSAALPGHDEDWWDVPAG